MTRNDNIVERRVHDSFFLINIKQNYLDDLCSLYEINEIGDFIWNNIDGKNDINKITALLNEQLIEKIDQNELLSDVNSFIMLLIQEGFVVLDNGRN